MRNSPNYTLVVPFYTFAADSVLRLLFIKVLPEIPQRRFRLNLSVGIATDARRKGEHVFFGAALAVPEPFPFALPMKLGRGTHCVYCTLT